MSKENKNGWRPSPGVLIMKDFVDWEKFNHAILNDIEVLLYERAVAVSDSDILQADRIKEVILENMNILSDASDI